MQAVLLAAGMSTRTHPLTLHTPKALLPVANVSLLEHNIRQLRGIVRGVIIVVGFGAEQIRQRIGNRNAGLPISYVEQKHQRGTADALRQAAPHVKGKCIVLMGDDLYSKEDIARCVLHKNAVLGQPVADLSQFGALVVRGDTLTDVVEKPKKKMAAFANTGCYVFGRSIFNYLSSLRKSGRGEYELTDALRHLAKKERVVVETVRKNWTPVTFPWSLLDANSAKLQRTAYSDIKGTVERFVTIKGTIIVGKGTIIRSGSYIEGPVAIGEDCVIGPNCHIRGATSIGSNSKVGNGCEVKNSVLMANCRVDHLSYVGDSVLGNSVHLGAGTVIANLRHDGTTIHSTVGKKLTDSGRKKLGAILGDDVQTGVNTSIYPGRKMWPGTWTRPGAAVKKDVVK